ncbi:hypothetical protein VTP01DRAFT_8521 [Rhizomucor pusillus]|uniref:uncharacterized protein n=1 Tax=Rhizomucor pusillus TaxID=4840 RepID=UPI003743592A
MLFLLGVHAALLAGTASLINRNVPEPYMDEIFHIPQAQRYCAGDYFTWDPKLTTPPGLYVISDIVSKAGRLAGMDLCASPSHLRSVNLVFSICLYPVLCRILTILHPPCNETKRQLYALALVWFPVLNFFNYLYYTDAGSTLFVLLTYMLVKEKCYRLAGLVAIVATTFRQTNIIWVCFFAAIAVIDILSKEKKSVDIPCRGLTGPTHAIRLAADLISTTLHDMPAILWQLCVFMLAVIGFAGFLLWNGGIVLGDKSNHVAGLHFPQLFYFSSFLSVFAAPWILTTSAVKHIVTWILQPNFKRGLILMGSYAVALYSVDRHTYEHPFLLSDNRHYSFYVWRKIYRRHWSVRYLLIPAYIISGAINLQALARNQTLWTVVGFIVSTMLTLVPSPLLEFRYFIIPFLLYTLHLGPPRNLWRTILAMGIFLTIHAATVYAFICKPFEWPQEPGQIQRFMW